MIQNNIEVLRRVSRLLAHFRKIDGRYREIRLPLRTMHEFSRVPMISKDDLAAIAKRHLPGDVFNVTATSGSTANRLVITHSRQCHQMHIHRLVRLYQSIGISSRDLCLNLCSYSLNSGGRLMEVAYKAVGAGVIPLGTLDSPSKTDEAVALVKMLRPTVVNSYTNQLFDLFSRLGREHSIRICIVNGEPLTKAFKLQIETMGGVKIHDHYGAMEVSGFAIAQKHTDEYMKIFNEGLCIEVLHDDGSTSLTGRGAIAVTDLDNRSMPFIRYKLGDRVDIRKRKDGLYVKVLGRLSDSILLNGEVYSTSEILNTIQQVVGHPHFFLLISKEAVTYTDKVLLNLPALDRSRLDAVRGLLKKSLLFGRGLEISFFQGQVPKTTTGKFKRIIDARRNP